jgi:nitroreductase
MDALKLRQSSRSFSPKALPLQTLSDLLWAGFGINRPESGKRTAPSSYNWQDITVYVFLPTGAYIYDAAKNQLTLVKAGDHRKLAGMQGFVHHAPLSLVLVSDLSKMTRKGKTFDQDYKMMVGSIDAGLILQNVHLYCASARLNCVVRASIDRKAFAQAFNLPRHMAVIVAQSIGTPAAE